MVNALEVISNIFHLVTEKRNCFDRLSVVGSNEELILTITDLLCRTSVVKWCFL